MTTVSQWLAEHSELPRIDAELIVAELLGINRAQIIASPSRELADPEFEALRALASRLSDGEPLAYITGVREFWGLEFDVSPEVLVPRPETELLVEIVSRETAEHATVLDLGTGSGAIAVALAKERPDLRITASDQSVGALRVAAENARKHAAQIRFIASDWFTKIEDEFQIIVCNPPYVREADPHLAQLTHEPRSALVAGGDGLDAIRHIVDAAPDHLATTGQLAIEHGFDQAAAVRALMIDAGFTEVSSQRDLSSIERVTSGRRGSR